MSGARRELLQINHPLIESGKLAPFSCTDIKASFRRAIRDSRGLLVDEEVCDLDIISFKILYIVDDNESSD